MKFTGIWALVLLTSIFMTKTITADDARLLFEKTLQTEPGKDLTTSLIAGSVTVTSWSNNEVSVKVYGNIMSLSVLGFIFTFPKLISTFGSVANQSDPLNNIA